MQAYKLKGKIDQSGNLLITEPLDLPPGNVEIVVWAATQPQTPLIIPQLLPLNQHQKHQRENLGSKHFRVYLKMPLPFRQTLIQIKLNMNIERRNITCENPDRY